MLAAMIWWRWLRILREKRPLQYDLGLDHAKSNGSIFDLARNDSTNMFPVLIKSRRWRVVGNVIEFKVALCGGIIALLIINPIINLHWSLNKASYLHRSLDVERINISARTPQRF